MYIDQDIVDELNLLTRFSRSSALDSFDIPEDAKSSVKSAAHRLFQKGIITRKDGGYLTERGSQAAECVNQLESYLGPDLEPI